MLAQSCIGLFCDIQVRSESLFADHQREKNNNDVDDLKQENSLTAKNLFFTHNFH